MFSDHEFASRFANALLGAEQGTPSTYVLALGRRFKVQKVSTWSFKVTWETPQGNTRTHVGEDPGPTADRIFALVAFFALPEHHGKHPLDRKQAGRQHLYFDEWRRTQAMKELTKWLNQQGTADAYKERQTYTRHQDQESTAAHTHRVMHGPQKGQVLREIKEKIRGRWGLSDTQDLRPF